VASLLFLFLFLLLLVAAPLFLLALYPPTTFDATTYHLPTAAAFARTGALPFLADLRAPVFPPLAELLSAIALLFADDVAAQLVQLLAAALTAGLLVTWGRHGFRPGAGPVAAALFLGSPLVVHLAASAYVEMTLTLLATAALFAAARWRGTGSAGWLVLAGFFAGSAAAVKYLGLYFVAAVGIAALAGAARGRRLRAALVVAAVALATLLPAYARIAAHTGNPVFPFLPEVFGRSPWTRPAAEAADAPLDLEEHPAELARRWARLPLLPYDLVFERGRTNHQPPLSPFYLLALPAVAVGAVRDRRLRRLLLPAAGYVALFPLLPQDARYLVPVLPLASLAAAEALLGLGELRPRRVGSGGGGATAALPAQNARHGGRALRRRVLTALLALACFLPGWLYAGWRIARQGPVPATAAARERYLASSLPVYPAVRFLNRNRGRAYAVYALHAENLAYFARGRFLGDWNGPAAFGELLPLLHDPAALHAKLRALGADHLLLVRGKDYRLPEDPAFRRLFREVYADSRARVFALRRASLRAGLQSTRGVLSVPRQRDGLLAPAAGAARPAWRTLPLGAKACAPGSNQPRSAFRPALAGRAPSRGSAASSPTPGGSAAGRMTVKTVRSPGALSTATRPPWALTMRSTMASPRPVPPLRLE
jgi:4-amino-4-deoxy-L-arabinose transferase-like glycosyltransferase